MLSPKRKLPELTDDFIRTQVLDNGWVAHSAIAKVREFILAERRADARLKLKAPRK